MKQVICVAQAVFTEEQLAEQKQFETDLENGNAKIAFEGTFEEGMRFLRETGKLVDACINT